MPDDLTLPHPAACADAPAPEGWTLTRESFVQDDERGLDLLLLQPGAPARSVALRLVGPEGADAPGEAFWAFAAAGIPAAIRADLAEQEAGVEAMAALLPALFPDEAGAPAQDLRAAWAETRKRLEAGLAASEKAGFSGEDLRIVRDYRDDKVILGLPRRGLVFALHKELAYAEFEPASPDLTFPNWRTKSSFIARKGRPRPLTEADIAQFHGLTGHEKMEFVAGIVPEAARAAFDHLRGARLFNKRPRPLRRPGGAAVLDMGEDRLYSHEAPRTVGTMETRDGDQLQLTLRPRETLRVWAPEKTWELEVNLLGQKTCVRLSSRACGILKRDVDKESAFRSPELLDDATARILAMVLDLDLPVPAEMLPETRDPFDPAHPVLSHPVLEGRAIPPRHQPLAGLILGAPYAAARPAAEAAARKAAAKAAKEAAVADLADQLPDGALFTSLEAPRGDDAIGLWATSLGMVQTVPGRGKGRTRKMIGLAGFSDPRTLTPKNLARMLRLERPDALALVGDDALDPGNRFGRGQPESCLRDRIEGAFRMSFLLAPGGHNPVLACAPTLERRDGAPDGPAVRVTHVGSEAEGLLALAVIEPGAGGGPAKTGAAIGAVTSGDRIEAWLRPAIQGEAAAAPEEDRASLRAALAGLEDVDPRLRGALEDQLGAPWDQLAKKWGTTCPRT